MSQFNHLHYYMTDTEIYGPLSFVFTNDLKLCGLYPTFETSNELETELQTVFKATQPVLHAAQSNKSIEMLSTEILELIEKPHSTVKTPTQILSMIDLSYGSPFQQAVWNGLLNISCGKTITYGEFAQKLGKPTAFRAVALACGRNPISILLPCHRVVGKSLNSGGYRWGMPMKEKILQFEKQID